MGTPLEVFPPRPPAPSLSLTHIVGWEEGELGVKR